MKKDQLQTPALANYRILDLIEQIVSTAAPKGTALGLCDVMSALLSGYFIESGGAIMPAVEAYLHQEIEDGLERAARSRRAAKAVTYGSYNLSDMIETVRVIVTEAGEWQPIEVGGYKMVGVDFTAYYRAAVKKMKTKAYQSQAGRAVAAVPVGMIAAIGQVREQRVALLKGVTTADLTVNEEAVRKKELYEAVAKVLDAEELAVFDAGFKLVEAAQAGIINCLIRLAKNVTFGQTEGKIPEKTSKKGRPPTQYKAKIVRPLAREHGGRTLAATAADETYTIQDEKGRDIKVSIWNKVYFLERQLKKVTDAATKKKLRGTPVKVMAIDHPDYDEPLLVGTLVLSLPPEVAYQGYASRWPVEGLPQTGKYILSGGGGTHYVHHPLAMQRLPVFSLIFGSLLKYVAATLPPFRTGFWDRALKPTYGRLLRQLKKVGIPLSGQLFKKESVTAHLPVGYEAIRLAKA